MADMGNHLGEGGGNSGRKRLAKGKRLRGNGDGHRPGAVTIQPFGTGEQP